MSALNIFYEDCNTTSILLYLLHCSWLWLKYCCNMRVQCKITQVIVIILQMAHFILILMWFEFLELTCLMAEILGIISIVGFSCVQISTPLLILRSDSELWDQCNHFQTMLFLIFVEFTQLWFLSKFKLELDFEIFWQHGVPTISVLTTTAQPSLSFSFTFSLFFSSCATSAASLNFFLVSSNSCLWPKWSSRHACQAPNVILKYDNHMRT